MHNTSVFAATPAVVRSSDGCDIAYWRGGNPDGPSIVFLHGFALDHTVWAAQFASPVLAQGYQLVAPDLRGHGRSGRPHHDSGYNDGALWAADLQAVIQNAGLRRPLVVAWSYGGRMLNDYLRFAGAGQLAGINYIAAATLAYRDGLGPMHQLLDELCTDGPGMAAVELRYAAELLRHSDTPPLQATLAQALAHTTPAQRARLRNRPLDYDGLLADLKLPLLLSHGAADRMILPALTRRLQQLLPHAQASLYDDAGHAPFIDDAARYNRELAAFANWAQQRRRA